MYNQAMSDTETIRHVEQVARELARAPRLHYLLMKAHGITPEEIRRENAPEHRVGLVGWYETSAALNLRFAAMLILPAHIKWRVKEMASGEAFLEIINGE